MENVNGAHIESRFAIEVTLNALDTCRVKIVCGTVQ